MTRAYILSGLIAVALAANAGSAMARDNMGGFGGPRLDFTAADTNSDGKLTQDEIKAFSEARFAAADTDGDGALSAEEMAARMEARMQDRAKEHSKKGAERMIERRDANKDGKISLEEIAPRDGGAKMFERLDADKDGAISIEELAAMKADHAKKRPHGKDGHGGHHKGGHKDGEHGKRFMQKNAPDGSADQDPTPSE